jgi:hypothetical protein
LPFSSHAFIICHLSSNQKAAKPRRLYHIEHWGSKFLLLTDVQTLHRNFLHLQKMGIDLYHLFVGWISAKSRYSLWRKVLASSKILHYCQSLVSSCLAERWSQKRNHLSWKEDRSRKYLHFVKR